MQIGVNLVSTIIYHYLQEIDCLEKRLGDIEEGSDCKKAVKAYIEEVDEDPEIDEIFARACAPFWEKHCQVGHCRIRLILKSSDFPVLD